MGPAEAPNPASHPLSVRSEFGLIVASHAMSAFGFSVFSLFPKYLIAERGLSQAQIGSATMGLPLGALLFSPLLAWALGRYRLRTIVRACLVVFALTTATFALVPPIALLPALAAVLGGACMGVFNGGAALTAEVAPAHALARALGLHGAAGMLSHAAGPLLLEPLAAARGFPAAFAIAAGVALLAATLPLPQGAAPARAVAGEGAGDVVRPLAGLLVVCAFAGVMHNALWTSHQPLVLARGGHEVRGYFFGMSAGAVCMRVLFGRLPDRIGHGVSALGALGLYVLAALSMTWVTPQSLAYVGLLHGIAHGVFYPSFSALVSSNVAPAARGRALTANYAAFNIGACAASFGFARFGAHYGPAAVFPCAAALGLVGFAMLVAQRRFTRGAAACVRAHLPLRELVNVRRHREH